MNNKSAINLFIKCVNLINPKLKAKNLEDLHNKLDLLDNDEDCFNEWFKDDGYEYLLEINKNTGSEDETINQLFSHYTFLLNETIKFYNDTNNTYVLKMDTSCFIEDFHIRLASYKGDKK